MPLLQNSQWHTAENTQTGKQKLEGFVYQLLLRLRRGSLPNQYNLLSMTISTSNPLKLNASCTCVLYMLLF